MHLKLPKFYRLGLTLAVVIGPFFWLSFTLDGQRRSDLVVLQILGHPRFNIGYERLSGTVTEAMLRAQFPKIDFQCQIVRSPFGDRQCTAPIAAFNGLPARAATLIFAGDRLRMLQLDYRHRYHRILERSLRAGLGTPREETTATRPVLLWELDGGQVLLPAGQVTEAREAALIWLATEALP